MKKLILSIVLIPGCIFAQSVGVNLSAGYKTVELGFKHILESEIILGGSLSLTDSKVIMDRANSVDRGSYLHKVGSEYTPTIFALVGAKFDRINIVGKVGFSNLNQYICKINDSRQTSGTFIKDSKNMYLALGVNVSYDSTEYWGVSGSFDNVNAATLGISFNL